jgi:hypothetical protein
MTYIISKVSKSDNLNGLAVCFEMSIPFDFATAIDRGSGGFPVW